jgi:hypothetical protein
MKTTRPIIVAILAYLFIVSCDKGDDGINQLEVETLCAKWDVSASNDYKSFEFNESGNYLIVRNYEDKSTQGGTTLFGTYEIEDKQTVELSNFGTIKLQSIDDDRFEFKLTLNDKGSEAVTIQGTRSAKIATSVKTKLFCRTWKLLSINDKTVAGTSDEATVLFSEAGTYYIDFANPDEENEDGLANWCWKDSNETIMCYSWSGEAPTCDGEDQVQITELTENSLTMKEYDETYKLEPASNKKSAPAQPNNQLSQSLLQQGIFKKR